MTPTLLALALCGVTLVLSACSKTEESVPPTAGNEQKPVEPAVSAMPTAITNAATVVREQAGQVKATAETAATNAVTQVQAVTAPAQSQAQALIDRVKALVAEKKYTEALSSLKEVSNLQLTPTQQTLVDQLKAQIQKAMATQATPDAAKSVGGMLNR